MQDTQQCPDCKRINEVLSRVGDRWSVLVIISLSRYGTLRFNELKLGESFREPVAKLGNWALENLATIDTAREAYDGQAEQQKAG